MARAERQRGDDEDRPQRTVYFLSAEKLCRFKASAGGKK
jgi:hypothetical protein